MRFTRITHNNTLGIILRFSNHNVDRFAVALRSGALVLLTSRQILAMSANVIKFAVHPSTLPRSCLLDRFFATNTLIIMCLPRRDTQVLRLSCESRAASKRAPTCINLTHQWRQAAGNRFDPCQFDRMMKLLCRAPRAPRAGQ